MEVQQSASIEYFGERTIYYNMIMNVHIRRPDLCRAGNLIAGN